MARYRILRIYEVPADNRYQATNRMMEAIVKSLRPGGRVVQVEYRGEDPNVPIKPHHKMTEAQAKKEMAAVGLGHVKTLEDLPRQHVLIFQKPAESTPGSEPPAKR